MDHPARLEGKVNVSGNWSDRALDEMNLTLMVSTRVVVPL